jgi:circadian clock protein KaiC
MYILKSRGMAHSNQIREFRLTSHGMELLDVYVGPAGVLTGSARVAQESRERAEDEIRKQQVDRAKAEGVARRKALEAQIAALEAELVAHKKATAVTDSEERAREERFVADRQAMSVSRKADVVKPRSAGGNRSKGGTK